MRKGGAKQKGTAFERDVCTKLSLWVSNGESRDWFWRSSMSGGRGTVAKRAGRDIKPIGDICAIDPGGHVLTDAFFIECKDWKNIYITHFVLGLGGRLTGFWDKACRQADTHRRRPMLIAKQFRMPTIMLVEAGALNSSPLAKIMLARTVDVYDFEALMRTRWEAVYGGGADYGRSSLVRVRARRIPLGDDAKAP